MMKFAQKYTPDRPFMSTTFKIPHIFFNVCVHCALHHYTSTRPSACTPNPNLSLLQPWITHTTHYKQ